jgi:hypothetical protein
MAQLTLSGEALHDDIGRQGYSFIDHGIDPEHIDALVSAYATFTDELPDPSLDVMNDMITDPNELDELDYAANPAEPWNKYHTNYPEFAKPGGYTNRSLQTAALRAAGRQVTDKATGASVEPEDDPKEYYHFHPNSTVAMNRMRETYGLAHLPPEVHELHARFARIHNLGANALKKAYADLEDRYPELVPTHFSPRDVQSSPVRLLFYHPGQGDVLAAGHYDKSHSTIQIAESHLGLWIRDPENGLITRTPDKGVFFLGKSWHSDNSFPESELKPGWHGVVNRPELAEGREMHGKNVARWAIIFFANSLAAGTITDKSETHTSAEN